VALNVLVVDDSAIVRSIILKSLRLAGIELGETHHAGNGQEGLDVLAKHWIDVVFADINMPGMNGEEMIENIRRNPLWADLPIVAVSTEGSETRIERLKGLGARFVHKPFPPEAIRNAVLEIIGAQHESRT
jgi:two-component system chemotaxis response regulator CheY